MKAQFDPNAAASEASGIFGLPSSPDDSRVHVFGVPFDATASYRKGAWRAPEAIWRASKQVDLFDLATGRPYEAGITSLADDGRVLALNREASKLADAIIARGGDVEGDAKLTKALTRVNAIGAQVNELVAGTTSKILDANRLPALVGGDHSTPFGAIRACAEKFPGLGVLHIDAHADLRVAYEGFEWSHASIMHNVLDQIGGVKKLVQVGVRDLCEAEFDAIQHSRGRIATLFDRDWQTAKASGVDLRPLIRKHLSELPKNVYLSFDIDGLDPTLCPNTGTPVPGGLSWGEAQLWLEELARTRKRVVGLDLNEVNPGAQSEGESDSIDAMVGARLLYRMIATALATRRGS